MAEKKTDNFEDALKELEKIVTQLESDELSLEQSLKSFEKGIKLTRQCQKQLKDAELKVQKLIEENGEIKTVPLDGKS
jgi:exodeoxyribonuclease VII small subunit|tara:strand:+ start:407 stop:640 length:234 start_codon:yes stop_codon:yes gene_type:complete